MTCFLCLQNLSLFDNGDEDKDKKERVNCEKISLAAINNYLKLSDNCSSDTYLRGDSKSLKVSMCMKCENVASRLTNLCIQLEEIKLKINFSLEQFYGRLEEIGEDEENNKLQEKLLLLRNSYRKKCENKLMHLRQPVIKLNKLQTVKLEMKKELVKLSDEELGSGYDDFDMNEGSSSEQEQVRFLEDVLEGKATRMEEDADNNWEEASSSFISSSNQSSSTHPRRKKKRLRGEDLEGNFICTTCGLKFASMWERRQHMRSHQTARKPKEANFICTKCDNHQMFKEANGLRRHNMIFHLELLFPHSRMEGISQDQFGDYCKHVIHVEGLISKLPNSSGYECQPCKQLGKNVHLKTYLCLKKHLFREHKDRLDEKVEELQKTTGPEELKQVVLPPVRDNRKCDQCGASFSQTDSLNRHLRQSCPFRKNKNVTASRPCMCQECGARYNGTAAFYRHRKDKHPNSTRDPAFI